MLEKALGRKAVADALLERTAKELGELLRAAAQELDPFPPFPGSFFTYAIEAEPGAAGRPDRGCIVVCPDGELYELVVSMDFSGPYADLMAARNEDLRPAHLPPQDYIVYAYNALAEITGLLLERQGKA